MTVDRRLVLASASPARLSLLRQAGLAPEVVVSDVDESAYSAPRVAEQVALLAAAKAAAVAKQALKERRTIREVVLERGHVASGTLTEEELDRALDVLAMTRGEKRS